MNNEQPDVLQLLASDVKKPTALVHFNRLPSGLDQRIMTLLIYNAQNSRRDDSDLYWIDARDIKDMIGWEASGNYDAIYEACRRLKGDIVQWNAFSQDRTIREEILCSFIITFRLQRYRGRIGYELHPKLAPIINSPTVFARIKLLMIFLLAQPRQAYPLYELLADTISRGLSTCTMGKDELLGYLGLGASAYGADWRNFGSKILKPACRAINDHSDLAVSFTPVREHRKIAFVRFGVSRKSSWQPPLLLEPVRALERINRAKPSANLDTARLEQDFIASVTPAVTVAIAHKAIAKHGLQGATEARDAALAYRERKGAEVKDFGSVLAKALFEGWQRAPEDRQAGQRAKACRERRERIGSLRDIIESIETKVRAERKTQLAQIKQHLSDAEMETMRSDFIARIESGELPSVYLDGYRRSGWDAPSLRLAFSQFLSSRLMPPEEEAIMDRARKEGHDLSALRAELNCLETTGIDGQARSCQRRGFRLA